MEFQILSFDQMEIFSDGLTLNPLFYIGPVKSPRHTMGMAGRRLEGEHYENAILNWCSIEGYL